MFYLYNVEQWLDEIVETCNRTNLDPTDAIFSIFLFSSLDIEYVDFFQKYRDQVSSYSGRNVHIITPTVFDNDIIPDVEWRDLRERFDQAGVRVGSRPSTVMFKLEKGDHQSGYDPKYFAAFNLPEDRKIAPLIRDFVSTCIENRHNSHELVGELIRFFKAPNLARSHAMPNILTGFKQFRAPRVFFSYSHQDIWTVNMFLNYVSTKEFTPWLDRNEIPAGSNILDSVKKGLASSDAIVMFLSKHSSTSSWIQFEGGFFQGVDTRKPVIPIVLDESGKELVRKLPFLSGRLYLDASGGVDTTILTKLVDSLKQLTTL